MAHPKDFGLEDPAVVGMREYRAIYETLREMLCGCEAYTDSPRDLALAVLDTFVGCAGSMHAHVAEAEKE